ncbi:MFS transporter [Paenibacillus sp. JX-17]|uniref:MFS transporter n=1 Tax=Paenibacillus lacisoli TaxID=3064525 RepID=A0ABT9CEJ0_9BACL|nr:MFS transporter [Paenibacillus sp. JX-17]MDO7907694.1 MFS transporter [Paenibacillus sp. JX-17]
MSTLFRNANFVRLFIASFASQLGTTVGNMAFAFYLLDHFAKQPYYATLAELMYSLPTLLVFFIVGVVADRFNRQRIAEYSDWIRVILSVLFLVTILNGWLPAAFLVLFLRSAVSKFFAPAEMAILQGIISKEQYDQAAGLNQMVFGVFMLFGMALGAVAYHTVGIQGAIIVDGVSYLVSGIMIRLCKVEPQVNLPNGPSSWKDLNMKLVLRDFAKGYGYIRSNHLLFTLIIGFFLFGFINGGFAVLPMFTMKYKLAPEHFEQFSSYFSISLGLGFLFGSVLGTVLVKKVAKHHIIIGGILLTALLTMSLAVAEKAWIYLVIIGIAGCVLAPLNIAIGGWMPELVEPDKMGRVSAWIDPVMMLAQSAALGLIAILYPYVVSLEMAYLLLGAVMLLAYMWFQWQMPRLVNRPLAERPLQDAESAPSSH